MAIIASALALALAGSTAAGADTLAISPPGREHDQFSLDVSAAPGGAAVAGWTSGGARPQAQAAQRPSAAARFSAPVTLGPGRMQRVAVASDGRWAAAVWLDGGRPRTARRDATGVWRNDRLPDRLPGGGIRVAGLTALPGGRAVLALEARTPEEWTVTVLRRGSDGRWRRAGRDLTVSDSASGRAAVDGAGRVTAAWLATLRGKPAAAVLVADLGGGGGPWSAGTVVATAGGRELFAEPVLSVDARGGQAVLIGALDDAGAPAGGRVAVRPATGGAWRLSAPTRSASIAMAPSGVVWGSWLAGSGSRRQPVVSRLRGTSWGAPDPAGPSGPVVGGPATAADAAGRPVVWCLVDGGPRRDRWRASWRGPRTWSRPAELGRTNGALAVSTGGPRGLAIWVTAGARGRVTAAPLR